VVTPDHTILRYTDDVEQVARDLEHEGIRRIMTGHRWRCLVPDTLKCWDYGAGRVVAGICRRVTRRLDVEGAMGWLNEAARACSSLNPDDVDVILASGPPFVSFRLAKRLADRLGRPYVLDYRDPWTNSPHPALPFRSGTIREEARLLAGSAAVTIVSHSWALALDRRFGVGVKLHVITNGYDPEELMNVKPHVFDHFAVVYAGIFYPPKRVISPVMAALRVFDGIGGKPGEWYFHYYGTHEDHVREEAKRFGLVDRVVVHGRVPRSEALSAVRGAGVAVVITSVFDNPSLEDEGIVTGKVFEVIGLATPMLLVAPPGSNARRVIENVSIAKGFVGSDPEGMASFLRDMTFAQKFDRTNVSVYAWTNLAKKLDGILRGVTGSTWG
jgi:glycosyltransferase involved in cell wall biosynthesis